MEAALGIVRCRDALLEECDGGSQMMMVNCFPACPEPELTLGMPPHSDFGLLTILLQDEVSGLEVSYGDGGGWAVVEPLAGAVVVNVGDHLEILSNGPYRSVLHRVRVNGRRARVGGVTAQPGGGAGDRAGGGVCGRAGHAAAVHGHRHGRLRRGQAQVLPPLPQDQHHLFINILSGR
ncbi:hypothetical protein E2562_011141 [Oryza meyeriana var. granulata]|uniref:Fe2OG dioxygenase domain-containing protein n=1 Tax=Oryza meyeriana var. granulata TaxID=110450 RepID=A0A6G1DF97_9ORYZ|nr:hypothetical protein E2562_011141 [Oryza meyeriana var. granulata]